MRVFVTGGTGFLGRQIVSELSRRGHIPVLLVRDRSKLLPLHNHFEIIDGALEDDYSVKLNDIDAVIHNAAKTPGADFTKAKNDEVKDAFFQTNIEGTKNLTQICQSEKIERFIYVSSHAVSNSVVNGDYYTISKREAENLVVNSSMKWTIIRPSGIFGLNTHWEKLLLQYKTRKSVVLPGTGKQIIDYIYVDDIANKICSMLEDNSSIHKKFIANGEKIKNVVFIRHIKRLFNCSFHIINIPLWMVKIVAGFLGLMNRRVRWKLNNIKSRFIPIDKSNMLGFIELTPEFTQKKSLELIKQSLNKYVTTKETNHGK